MSGREYTGTELMSRKLKLYRPCGRVSAVPEGGKLTVTLREYRPGDEEGMIACIRDEYGDTYFKRNLYSPDYIRQESECGHITFLVAETRAGEIAGMMLLKQFAPEESMCEIASQIFRKKYRGYGLAMPFFEYGMGILLGREYSAAYCLPVMFHNTTQRLLYRMGLRATGFVLNVFDLTHITHSYKNGRNTKHSLGIQIRAVGKQDAGTIYVPEKHQDFCRQIYDNLGVSYRLGAEKRDEQFAGDGDCGGGLPSVSSMTYTQDALQSNLEIRVHCVGLDLPERIASLHEKFILKGKQTANLFLNINDPHAVWAYRVMDKMGYYFTGLKPLCSDREYMVLHQPGEVEIYWGDYILTEEFSVIARYIKFNEKERRKVIGKL